MKSKQSIPTLYCRVRMSSKKIQNCYCHLFGCCFRRELRTFSSTTRSSRCRVGIEELFFLQRPPSKETTFWLWFLPPATVNLPSWCWSNKGKTSIVGEIEIKRVKTKEGILEVQRIRRLLCSPTQVLMPHWPLNTH